MTIHCTYKELVATSALKRHPKNPNRHSKEQIERLAKILKYQGWRYPIKVSNQSGYITSGHGRLEAALLNEWTEVPVDFQDYEDDDMEYADLVADNAIAEWAELDLSGINKEIENLGPIDIDLLGIKDFVVDMSEKNGGNGDEDALPDTPAEPKSRLGDLWILGNHRVLCGDSTKREDVERLMGGEKADMVFTDPPYGISLDTDYTKMGDTALKHRPVEGDDKEFDPTHILAQFEYCEEIFLWGANYYCWYLPRGGSWVCWDKRSQGEERIGMMDDMFGSDFELCWSKTKHQNKLARILKPTGRYAIHTDERFVHPAQKPVTLAEYFIERWGNAAKLIWDGYLGSGSSLIACEKTNRRCFGMEIDPHYIDVILTRWAKYTGQDPVREDGVKWSALQ